MALPILSVVIPIYNFKQYICCAARSILKQPCVDCLELLLVDDGSTDGSGAICDQIASEAPNGTVRVFHQKNSGVSSARNLGIQEARGKYIAFLDADDWWMPDFFDSDLAKMLTGQFDVLSFSYLSISPDCRWYKENHVQNIEVREQTAESKPACPVTHWSCLYRRDHLLQHQIRYLPCKINEDVPFIHLAFSLAESVKSYDKPILCYWSNPQSSRRPVHITLEESLQSLMLEETAYKDRGLALSNDRTALTVFYTRLPRLCCEMPYRRLRDYLRENRFDIIWQKELKPWGHSLQKRAKQYKQHPFLFWLKSRITPGIPLFLRRLLEAVPFTRRFVYFIHFRLFRHWKKYTSSGQLYEKAPRSRI